MLNVYVVKDLVADNVICSFSCPNDGLAIRENAPALSKVAPLGDIELIHVAEMDNQTLDVKPVSHRVVSWDSYKFPESPIKPVATTEKVVTNK